MPLDIPKIDERDYKDILAEALVRIPVHNPRWTNFNDSDPGITIVQLFAFMTENLLYRANLIPERNRVKFLKLLGIPVRTASTATGIVTFSKPRGDLKVETVDKNLELFAGQVPFRTGEGIDILPVEANIYYKKKVSAGQLSPEGLELYRRISLGFPGTGEAPAAYYESRILESPVAGAEMPIFDFSHTVDNALWIALLARPVDIPAISPQSGLDNVRRAIGGKILSLGILPSLTDAPGRTLSPGSPVDPATSRLTFSIPIPQYFSSIENFHRASYRELTARPSGDLLAEPGIVHLQLPESSQLEIWENLEPFEAGSGNFPPFVDEDSISKRIITWIRISAPEEPSLNARFSWVGINAVTVRQGARTTSEIAGHGSGEPDQTVTLANLPVIPGSLRLTVDGEEWDMVDDLTAAAPEVPKPSPRLLPLTSPPLLPVYKAASFSLDSESGEIRFGDGLRGARPPGGAVIRVEYDYGGGVKGNVGIDQITTCHDLNNGIKVTNPIPAWGGDEAETTDEAEKKISRWLRHRDRLVSADDFREIALRTPGIQSGRIEILPLFQPDFSYNGLTGVPGVVTVFAIPAYDSLHPDTPEPDRLFLDTLCRYLEPRRLVTTELFIRGPVYVPIWLSVGIQVVEGMDEAPVRENVKEALRTFLSPLHGGFESRGWPLEKAIENGQLSAAASRVNGVSMVREILSVRKTEQGLAEADNGKIPLFGLQLPRIMAIDVQNGSAKSIEDVLADSGYSPSGEPVSNLAPAGFDSPAGPLPLPVILPECR